MFSPIGRNGDTADSIHELIGVSPETEALLRRFASKHHQCARGVEAIPAYRQKVGEELERLAANAAPAVNSPHCLARS